MSALRNTARRSIATLWVALLGFLALAQPAHALLGSGSAALFAQALGALGLAVAFAFRSALRRQCDRLFAFLGRSRGLRAIVREVAVGALAAPSSEASAAKAAGEYERVSAVGTARSWTRRETAAPRANGAAPLAATSARDPALGARP